MWGSKRRNVRGTTRGPLIVVKLKQRILRAFQFPIAANHIKLIQSCGRRIAWRSCQTSTYVSIKKTVEEISLLVHGALLLLRSPSTCSKTGSAWLSYLQAHPEQGQYLWPPGWLVHTQLERRDSRTTPQNCHSSSGFKRKSVWLLPLKEDSRCRRWSRLHIPWGSRVLLMCVCVCAGMCVYSWWCVRPVMFFFVFFFSKKVTCWRKRQKKNERKGNLPERQSLILWRPLGIVPLAV